jgi:DNA ligase-1
MKRFASLFSALDATTKTTAKTAALAGYFRDAPDEDRLWTIALLSGRRPKRAVTATELREWAAEAAGLPLWLFEEAYPVVGDLAETIALILPPPSRDSGETLSGHMRGLIALAGQPAPQRRAAILESGPRRAVPVQQADHRRLPDGGQPGADDTGAGAGDRAGGSGAGPPPDGQLDARKHHLCRADPVR